MRVLHALIPALAFAAATASAGSPTEEQAFQAGLESSWELFWDQRGAPVRLVRWDKPMKVWMGGLPTALGRQQVDTALHEVAKEAGVPLQNVADEDDANVKVLFVSDQDQPAYEPCVTRGFWSDENVVEHVEVRMRVSQVYRCAYHESMHVMGLQGHPSGPTVLSYFIKDESRMQPLDRVFLHAWYSRAVAPGASGFEVVPVVADELGCQMTDRAGAQKIRDEFLVQAYLNARAYVAGKGDVPEIVRRSGKARKDTIDAGRAEMLQLLPTAARMPLFRALQCKSPLITSKAGASISNGEIAYVQHAGSNE